MANVFDVAEYILHKCGPMTAMKLQKLVYYCQAWSLVWDEKPLFRDKIEAWANGPVVPRLYRAHKGCFRVKPRQFANGQPELDDDQKATVDAVLAHYAGKSSQWLSDLTHAERPWKEAREGLKPGERGHSEITRAAMAEYYGSL